MKRRVGIAQAMLNDPKILILDEPTAGLDPNERIRFRNLISELSEDRLVLLSTHIANEILLMKDGSLVLSGTSEEITSSIPEKIWSCTVSKPEIGAYMAKYKIANIKTVPGGAQLRVISMQSPCENAVLESASLEDAFLYYFGEKAGMNENDDEI